MWLNEFPLHLGIVDFLLYKINTARRSEGYLTGASGFLLSGVTLEDHDEIYEIEKPIYFNGLVSCDDLKVGDYVFASHWSDCDPNDPWHVGQVTEVGTDFVVVGDVSQRWWRRATRISPEKGKEIIEWFTGNANGFVHPSVSHLDSSMETADMKLENKILSLLIENNVRITTKIVELVDGLCNEINKDKIQPSDDRFMPDWSNVDSVYKYHAYDTSGNGYFYASEPTFLCTAGFGEWVVSDTSFTNSEKSIGNLYLYESERSLRMRPE